METIAYSMIGVSTYFVIDAMIVSFFIGISLYFHAFYKHFAVLVREIDNPPAESDSLGHKKEIHAKRILREAIQLHIFEKE